MELKYGNQFLQLKMPRERILASITDDTSPSGRISAELIDDALAGCQDILKGFSPGEKVLIITSDITRYSGSEIYLPILVDMLNAGGIDDDKIEVLIALGIHRKQTREEHMKIVGPLFNRIKVVDHDCDDPSELTFIGRTSSGIDVEINRRVIEADKLILTGAIGFHYFAGFSGGRKSILPGVAGRKSCMASHFAVLNPEEEGGRNPAATTGCLEGNPVHKAMMEACAMVNPSLILNTVISPDKRLIAAFAGDWREAHQRGCEFYSRRFSFTIHGKADLVILSCGGFPKDINFIQAHKSMEYGSQALKDAGIMIFLAQCREGYGHPTFFNWFRFRDLAEFEVELRSRYEINGQTAYSTLQKTKRFNVILISELPPEEVKVMGMTPAASLGEALELAEKLLPADYSVYVIPAGGAVLPVLP